MAQKIVRLPEVLKRVPLCRTSIWSKVKSGLFPQPVHIAGGKAIGWIETELDAWIEAHAVAHRKTVGAE